MCVQRTIINQCFCRIINQLFFFRMTRKKIIHIKWAPIIKKFFICGCNIFCTYIVHVKMLRTFPYTRSAICIFNTKHNIRIIWTDFFIYFFWKGYDRICHSCLNRKRKLMSEILCIKTFCRNVFVLDRNNQISSVAKTSVAFEIVNENKPRVWLIICVYFSMENSTILY